MKINDDGGISHNGQAGATMAMCRDQLGMSMGSSSIVLPGVMGPRTLEAIACRKDQALAKDLSLIKFVITRHQRRKWWNS